MKPAKGIVQAIAAAMLAVPVLLNGQTPDVAAVLAETRKALGGDKLEQLQSLVIEGRVVRPGGMVNGKPTTSERPFELNIKLPDKMMRREVLAAMGNMSVYRHTGFNGADGLINQTDQPPALSTGGGTGTFMVMRNGPAGASQNPTPEQKEAQRKTQLLTTKKDYARLALGLFAAAPAVYPLEFTYGGEAQAPDGTAHIVDVKGEGDFAVRLFIDQKTHLPLMLSWMDKEPATPQVLQGTSLSGSLSREDLEKRMRESAAAAKEAEAKRRTVEWRLYYGEYKNVNGVMLPHRFQTRAEGKTTDEMSFERVRVNQKIDDDKFKVSK